MKHRHDVMSDHEKSLALQMIYRPVIEQEVTETSIITQTPEKILKAFDTIKMPLINGCTNSEGILGLRMILKRLDGFNQNVERLVPQLMGELSPDDKQKIGKEIRQFYFGDKKIDKNTLNEMCDLMSDNIFITNTMISAEWLAKYQPNVKHYHYRFTYDGRLSFCKRMFNLSHVPGACHSDDIFYLFNSKMLPNLRIDSEEYRIRSIMIRMWTNFAKYGDPTPELDADDDLLSVKWKPMGVFESAEFNVDCLEIDVNPKMIRNPCANRIQLWRRYLQTFRKDYL
uniref:carboxylesterase n=1 Tax=Culex pipiens TaxID=7175 RepID=A0A8D8MGT3_CULPI